MSQDVVWGFLCTVRILKNIAGWKPLKTWDDEWLWFFKPHYGQVVRPIWFDWRRHHHHHHHHQHHHHHHHHHHHLYHALFRVPSQRMWFAHSDMLHDHSDMIYMNMCICMLRHTPRVYETLFCIFAFLRIFSYTWGETTCMWQNMTKAWHGMTKTEIALTRASVTLS